MNPNWSDTTRYAVHDRDDHWLCDIEFGPGNTTWSQSRTKADALAEARKRGHETAHKAHRIKELL